MIRHGDKKTTSQIMWSALLTSTAFCISMPAVAQDAPAEEALPGEIVVTATKREESLQKVPLSIQALGEETLDQQQVSSLDDFSKLLPSVSFQSFGPGQSQIYFRGVSSGGDGLRIGPTPATGLYLDEIPVTTIAGSVDLHVYDIARIEALSGPQGTLFGASSLSGTLRLITNKPSTAGFEGGADLQVNKFGEGEFGGSLESFLNLPLSDNAALRVVGFYRRDGGYIDNIPGSRTFTLDDSDPTTNLTVNNAALVENDFNDVETFGGRAALKVDLNENWTVTPAIIYQDQKTSGPFLFDPRKGDLAVTDFQPTRNTDRWFQAALTVEGKVGNWDLVYSGGYFERKVNSAADYSYYSVAYDTYGSYYTNFPTSSGGFLDPSQFVFTADKYTKQTHELRFVSPSDKRFRLTTGVFFQRQTDDVAANYDIAGLSTIPTPPNSNLVPVGAPYGDTVFLTRIDRKDRDLAIFAEGTFDITDTVKLTAGIRGFEAKSSLFGFSGFNRNALAANCLPTSATNRPCDNVDKKYKETGETHKVNLSWEVTPEKMIYATYSTGFRPGGNNRRPGILPFKSDTLTNYEIGWKTSWLDRKLRLNGAVFYEEWKDLQFGLVPVGNNGVTNTYNAGDARIYGAEGDFALSLGNLTLSGSGTYIDAKLTTDFCQVDATGNIVCTVGVAPAAPKGTRLPVQPKFKGSLTARYEFPLGSNDAFLQSSVNHQGGTRSFLTDADFAAVGGTRGFTTFDFSAGTEFGQWTIEAFIQNAFDKRGQLGLNTACSTTICGAYSRVYPIKPQIFGLKLGTKF
ncbi:TonB-dependent receptor [Sphingorhabdus sp.]|uniref:TonB-dependent receptor n=1 Tax=Sphingorhabdus sp. TaxID=1902408 RepID=UPI003982ECA0